MRLLILDRDGVINAESPQFIKSAEEWIPIPGSLRAICRATQAGFRIFVVSNQSGLARGKLDIEELNGIHRVLNQEVQHAGGRIEGIFFCPHAPEADCRCRKPKTALLEAIAARTGADLRSAVFIGDRASDMEAALAVGARPILVRTGHGGEYADTYAGESRVTVCADLAAAVTLLMEEAA
ncbi:MAG: D-glycero-beta-D-manno-heptose 1,7-bisphosphate 7-phosphatase [Gammaproteobacteria bacterium]|nr:D-glycero-beta-D-manno-heptose 1,7-bisphosphate 7-phosphatase [Gammaproteobacteria bacterium]MBI5618983.1 D-glycero-beta-D-manno-heptose 1,7-bisphosphate 7-phosphatase [Gammaproteobacteria bacterium]